MAKNKKKMKKRRWRKWKIKQPEEKVPCYWNSAIAISLIIYFILTIIFLFFGLIFTLLLFLQYLIFFFVEKKQKNIYLALFRLTSVNMQNKVNKRHMENFFQGVLRTKQCDLKSNFFRQIIQAQLIHTRRMFRRPGSNTDRTVLRRAILRTILCVVHKLQFILR